MKVKASIIAQFRNELRQQALMHTRHRVKRLMEYRVDGRFANINMFEEHISRLTAEINPRGLYENFCRLFRGYVAAADYASVLRVYNQKSMLPASNVAALCGLKNKDEYIRTILQMLRDESRGAERIRKAVTHCFGLDIPRAADGSGNNAAPGDAHASPWPSDRPKRKRK